MPAGRGRSTQGRGVTREQKLGLIAGFTVVLLFGVLLADHLSRARAEPLIVADQIDEPLVIPTPGEVPARMGSQSLPARPRVVISEPVPMEPVMRPAGDAAVGGVREPLINPERVASVGASIESIFERVASAGPRQAVSLPMFEPVGRDGGSSAAPAPAERARTHEVKSGESLFRISERYYGNGHLWRKLAERNRGVVDADGGVGIGAVLTIPSKASLTGEAGASAPVAVARTTGPVEKTYVVKAGDTLSEISMKLLGTTKRMDELIAMNRDQIRDADDIRVGMKLRYRAGPSA